MDYNLKFPKLRVNLMNWLPGSVYLIKTCNHQPLFPYCLFPFQTECHHRSSTIQRIVILNQIDFLLSKTYFELLGWIPYTPWKMICKPHTLLRWHSCLLYLALKWVNMHIEFTQVFIQWCSFVLLIVRKPWG